MKLAKAAAIALSVASAAHAATSSAFGQDPGSRADAILAHAMKDRLIPGLQIAVVQNGHVVFSRSYGVANLQTPVPVRTDTLFSINSITKAFVGVAVMEEVQRGRLVLSAPVSSYLPDLPPDWGKVTVLELLGQISGLPDVFAYDDSANFGIVDEKAAWAWALKQPVSPRGVKEDYCQTNLWLIQLILNKLNGREPDAPVIGEQLKRADMHATLYGDSRDVIQNRAQTYQIGDHGVLWNEYERFGPMMHANSGLNTTADDMARWMISILDGRQMDDHAREMMWTPVPLNNGSQSSFAIGWDVQPHVHYTAFGMFGGARSAFALYPKFHLGVVILTNLLGAAPEELTDELAAAFDPRIQLSGVIALRAQAEKSDFANLDALIAVAASQGPGEFNEREFVSWIVRLLGDDKSARAVKISRLYRSLFPQSKEALELLGRSYEANAQHDDARHAFSELLVLDPENATARRYLARH